MRFIASRSTQIDWLLSALRWVLLFSVLGLVLINPPVGAEPLANSSQGILVLLIIAAGYNLLTMILMVFELPVRPLSLASLVVDALLSVALLIVSGGDKSPLLYFSLFPILTAALRFSWLVVLVITLGIGAAYYGMGGAWPNLMILALAGLVGGALGNRVRRLAMDAKRAEEESELYRLRSTREQARAIFEMASTLSATLNYQRILDAVLDVSTLGLKEIGPASTRMVSLVLLLSNQGLTVAASRHLTGHDERLPLIQREDGAISRTLSSAEPVICEDPQHDSELTTYTALHRCLTAVCVPLRAGFENYGVAVFGSPDPNVFTQDTIDVLTAVCNQAIIALQNAQLFESLQGEKARIVEIEEDARKKLARDLHDGPTQSVAAIAMRINYARALLQRDPSRVGEELEKIEELARNTTKEIRQMLFTLRPLVLETQGLKAALETLVQKLHDTEPSLQVHLELDANAEKLDKNMQGMLFYVIEEAVGNARKHAQAKDIWIRSGAVNGDYFIEVQDNGQGFDVSKVQSNYDKRGSLGMVNMYERAEVLNAKLSIASAIGQGTRVSMRLPLEPTKK
ncbi:MAG: histidine kinase [Anaerolineae bacterium]